jgi:ATP-dependent Lhr-like helicase
MLVMRRVAGPRRLLLAGRPWQVREIDWERKRLYVEPSDVAGAAQWFNIPRAQSYALTDAMRQVAAGSDVPDVTMSQRATQALRNLRASHEPHVDPGATVLVARDAAWHTWWTWAGGRGNLTLAAALDGADPGLIADEGRASDFTLRVAADAGAVRLRQALAIVRAQTAFSVDVDPYAVRGLKFNEMLPQDLALDTLAQRLVDADAARKVAGAALIDRSC